MIDMEAQKDLGAHVTNNEFGTLFVSAKESWVLYKANAVLGKSSATRSSINNEQGAHCPANSGTK